MPKYSTGPKIAIHIMDLIRPTYATRHNSVFLQKQLLKNKQNYPNRVAKEA